MKRFARIAMLLAAAFCIAAGATNARAATGDAVDLNVPFDPDVRSYSATVSNDVTEITVVARARHSGATVTVNGGDPDTPVKLAVGGNAIAVVVTAEDGKTRRTYTVTVTREAAADGGTSPQVAGYTVPDSLVRTVRHYYEINRNNPGGGENWFRVLIAFGAETHATLRPYTAAEAAEEAKRWGGWRPVLDALRKIEAANGPPPAPAVPTVSLSAVPNPVAEGSAVRVTATLSAALAGGVTVPVAVTRGTSEDGDHGTLASIAIPAGSTSATGTITTADDADADDETFTVALGTLPAGVATGSESSVAVTITDGDTTQPQTLDPPAAPAVTIAAGSGVTEGASASFTLTANPAPAQALAVTVTVSQSGAVAQASALGARTVTIAAGETSVSFTAATVNDAADEADGAIVVSVVAGSGYTVGAAASASVAVADDDEAADLPAMKTKMAIAREGAGAVTFRVMLDRPAPGPATVDWTTADGSGLRYGKPPAKAGADYTASSGTVTIPAGKMLAWFQVPIVDDSLDEGMEHFLVRYSNPRGATLAAPYREAVGLIHNDDPLQAMWLSRFGRMVASDAVEAVTARLETPRAAGSHLTLRGQRLDLSQAGDAEALAEALTGLAQAFGGPAAPAADEDDPFRRHGLSNTWNDPATTVARPPTGRELLLGSSFRAVLPAGAGSQFTSWGQGASVSRFSAAVPGLGLTGEAATGSMGFDYESGRLLTGFAMTHSVGDGAAQDAGWSYRLGSTATTVLPYARYALTERVSAWAMAGTGTGRMTLDLDGPVRQRYGTGPRDDAGGGGGAGRAGEARRAGRLRARAQGGRVLGAHGVRPGRVVGVREPDGRAGRVEPGACGAGRLAQLRAGGRRDAGAEDRTRRAPRRRRRGDRDGSRVRGRPGLRGPVAGARHGAPGARPRGACRGRLRGMGRVGAAQASAGRRGTGPLGVAHAVLWGGPGRLGAAVGGAGRQRAGGERRGADVEPSGRGSGLRHGALRRPLHGDAERRLRDVGHGARVPHRLAADLGGAGRSRVRGQSRRDPQGAGQRQRTARARVDAAESDSLVRCARPG